MSYHHGHDWDDSMRSRDSDERDFRQNKLFGVSRRRPQDRFFDPRKVNVAPACNQTVTGVPLGTTVVGTTGANVLVPLQPTVSTDVGAEPAKITNNNVFIIIVIIVVVIIFLVIVFGFFVWIRGDSKTTAVTHVVPVGAPGSQATVPMSSLPVVTRSY